jgi:hypothetical protein
MPCGRAADVILIGVETVVIRADGIEGIRRAPDVAGVPSETGAGRLIAALGMALVAAAGRLVQTSAFMGRARTT